MTLEQVSQAWLPNRFVAVILRLMKRRTLISRVLLAGFFFVVDSQPSRCLLARASTFETEAPEVRRLLEKVAVTYRNLERYRFDFTLAAETRSTTGRRSMETRVEMAASRPGKLRLSIAGGLGELQVYANGEFTWVFVPLLKQYTRRPAGGGKDAVEGGTSRYAAIATQTVEQFERIARGVRSARRVRTEKLEVEGTSAECVVVEVELEEEEPGERRTRTYWIDPQRKLVLKAVQFDQDAGEGVEAPVTEVTTTFSRAEIGEAIPEEVFVFTPPSDAKEVAEFPKRRPAAIEVGSEAADFQLKDLEDREVQLRDLRGQVVLLNFWASWCGPCRLEMPVIEKLHQEFHEKGLRVFGVNDEDIDVIRDYVAEHEYSFPTLVDPEQQAITLYRVRGIPTMVVIDREGKIARYRTGLSREAELRSWLKKSGIE